MKKLFIFLIPLIILGVFGYIFLTEESNKTLPNNVPDETDPKKIPDQEKNVTKTEQTNEKNPAKDDTDGKKNWVAIEITIHAGEGGGGQTVPSEEPTEEKPVEIPTKMIFQYPGDLLTQCPEETPFPNLISRDLDVEKCWYSVNEISSPSFFAQLGSYGYETDIPILDLKKWRTEAWAPDYQLSSDAVITEGSVNGMKTLEERTSTKVITYLGTGTGRVFSFTYYPVGSKNEELYKQILSTFQLIR